MFEGGIEEGSDYRLASPYHVTKDEEDESEDSEEGVELDSPKASSRQSSAATSRVDDADLDTMQQDVDDAERVMPSRPAFAYVGLSGRDPDEGDTVIDNTSDQIEAQRSLLESQRTYTGT
jgi:hypothetical protein